MNKFLALGIFLFALLLPVGALAQTEEKILSFNSQIEVFEDGSMQVTETIKVRSAGEQIQRGIYRDFPITYTDRTGRRYQVGFEILSVSRNGNSEPYHTERAGNGLRIYVGKADVFIPSGEHAYVIKYQTDRQLGFFDDHDELYWNVTGNGWIFGIDSITAVVKLPSKVPAEQIGAQLYTGATGSSAQDGNFAITDGAVLFASSRPLNFYEGMTIVVTWPKGVVAEPTAMENFLAAVKYNLDYLIGIFGFLLVLGFYLYTWNKHGRDPKSGSIIAQYESPQGLSPAMLRYIKKMAAGNEAFAAAIISLGVKGRLKITENKGFLRRKTFTLERLAGQEKGELSMDEQVLFENLFAEGNVVTLENKSASRISKIKNIFSKALEHQEGKKYFKKNVFAVVIGFVMSACTLGGAVIAAVVFRFGLISPLQGVFYAGLVIGLIAVNIIFAWLMRAYTNDGRKLADEIEGFKLFLSVTEKDRLAFHNPPEKTPELFEKMLPYALALGVEHEWAEQFKNVFARLENQGVSYAPLWYHGSSLAHFNPTAFSSDIGKGFAGVVAASATPPGSSSGMGGFSGGGGGGGGGGGW